MVSELGTSRAGAGQVSSYVSEAVTLLEKLIKTLRAVMPVGCDPAPFSRARLAVRERGRRRAQLGAAEPVKGKGLRIQALGIKALF